MTKIFKLDTEIKEDIEQLHTLIKDDAEQLKGLYEHILITGALPEEFAGYSPDDLIVYEMQFQNNLMLKIFPPFFIITNTDTLQSNIIEFDSDDGSIYGYNLATTDSDMLDLIKLMENEVQHVYELAEDLALVETVTPLVTEEKLSMSDMIWTILYQFDEFKDLTKDDIIDLMAWLGYTKNKRTLN